MGIISTGASQTVTLSRGSVLSGRGNATIAFGPGASRGQQRVVSGLNWAVGPFSEQATLYVTANTAVSFTIDGSPSAPAIRTPIGDRIATLGDSLQARGYQLDPLRIITNSAIIWGCALLKQDAWVPFGEDPANNLAFAVSGVSSLQTLETQVPRAEASDADWWSVQVGTNDFVLLPGDAAGDICARLEQICARGLARGVRIALWTIPPRNDNSGPGSWQEFAAAIIAAGSTVAAQRLKQMQVNSWMRRYAATTPGVVLCDPYNELVNPASATGDWRTGANADGVHWSTAGAFIAGRVFAQAMRPFVTSAKRLSNSQQDVYDATFNPSGNLATSFTMQGSGGSVGGAGVSGSPPTGWTIDIQAGTLTPGTATVTTQARTDVLGDGLLANGREVQVAIAGSAPGAFQLRAYQTTSLTVPAGQPYFVDAAIAVSANTAGIVGPGIQVFFNSGVFSMLVESEAGALAGITLPAGALYDAIFRTPIQIPTAAAAGLIFTQLNGTTGTQGTFKLRGLEIRRLFNQ